MCVESLPTFAPNRLRDAWGLHPPSRVGTRNRPALLRTPPLAGYPRAVGAPPRRRHAPAVTRRVRPLADPVAGPGVLERPRGSAYAGGFRTHMTSVSHSALRIRPRHFEIRSSAFDIRNCVPLRPRTFVPPYLRTPLPLLFIPQWSVVRGPVVRGGESAFCS